MMRVGDVRAVADLLRAQLAAIESGEMDASPTMRARIEGAFVALDVIAGGDPATLVDRLTDTD